MSRVKWLEIDEGDSKEKPQDPTAPQFDDDYYINQGYDALGCGENEKALRYFSRALNGNHLLEDAWLGQVLALIDMSDFHEALTWCDKALDTLPEAKNLLAAKALVLGRIGQIDKALGFSDSSLKGGDRGVFAWLARGDVLLSAKERTAGHCFQKALESGIDDYYIPLRIGIAYLSAKMPMDAKKYFSKARSLDEDRPVIHFYLAQTYLALGDRAKALQFLSNAVSLNPHFTDALNLQRRLDKEGFLKGIYRRIKRVFSN